ncbi:MAG TPA: hypothetical protein VJM11_04430 [Nevskiaceae bacterium]|nr:hypothetical protein [Nevskiaceae bacterium]
MSDLALQAEHQKLARLLGCPESTVEGLKPLDVTAFRQLRAACTSMLFDGDRAAFQRVVASSRLLPLALKALIAEKALGPVIASRVAGLMPPDDAAAMAQRVSLDFNVEVTLLIDPRSATPLMQRIPVSLVQAVTRVICKRREYIAMARFVDALTDEQIRATMDVIDDESMLRVGFYVESMERLEEVVALMPDERLSNVVAVAARPELDLEKAVLMLLAGVSDRLRARLVGAALGHRDPAVGESLIAAAREHGMLRLFDGLAPLMNPGAGVRLRDLLSAPP